MVSFALTRVVNALRQRRDLRNIRREIEAGVARQRVIREARAEAARRGVSTEWQRRGQRARRVFGA